MRVNSTNRYIYSHKGENRHDRRFSVRFKKRNKKSYFVMSNEVMERYRCREISAVDVAVYSALCNLRREYDGVRVSRKRLAFMCGITEKTVSASVYRLYSCGLIRNVITEVVKQVKKYKTSVYQLKPLPKSGFFFAPRHIFLQTRITPKMFAMYLFMCRACSVEYAKSWNSYGDICDKLGFGKGQRSEVVKLIGSLVECELLKKTVRRIKGVFVDNIYRVAGFYEVVEKADKKQQRPSDDSGTLFTDYCRDNEFVQLTFCNFFNRTSTSAFFYSSG